MNIIKSKIQYARKQENTGHTDNRNFTNEPEARHSERLAHPLQDDVYPSDFITLTVVKYDHQKPMTKYTSEHINKNSRL